MRTPRFLPLVFLLTAIACGSDTTTSTPVSSAPVSVAMPSAGLPGLHHTDSTLDAAGAAADATHPDSMTPMLSGAGLIDVRDRTYTGAMHGPFSRVVIRAWLFASTNGAGSFLDWVRVNASHELIGEAAPLVEAPGGTVVWRHDVTGCCHGETPIYLAVWQRDHIVWTIRASGPRIRTAPVLALVRSIEREV